MLIVLGFQLPVITLPLTGSTVVHDGRDAGVAPTQYGPGAVNVGVTLSLTLTVAVAAPVQLFVVPVTVTVYVPALTDDE